MFFSLFSPLPEALEADGRDIDFDNFENIKLTVLTYSHSLVRWAAPPPLSLLVLVPHTGPQSLVLVFAPWVFSDLI